MVDAPVGIASRRRSGFERPFHPFQIATWALYPLVLLHYYAFLHFLLWSFAVRIAMLVVFTVLAVMMGASVYLTCATDPADDSLCDSSGSSSNNNSGSSNPQPVCDQSESQHCYLCHTDVHKTSLHCRTCSKCVTRFDHHCNWLNTCIGRKNYPYFLLIVCSTSLLTTQSLALSIALVIDSFANEESFEERLQLQRNIGSDPPVEALQALLLLSVVVLLPLVLMVYQLLGFHMMLLRRGITTYEYIVDEQRAARERDQAKKEKEMNLQKERMIPRNHDSMRAPNAQQQQQQQQQQTIEQQGVELQAVGGSGDDDGNSSSHSSQKQQQQLHLADDVERGEGKVIDEGSRSSDSPVAIGVADGNNNSISVDSVSNYAALGAGRSSFEQRQDNVARLDSPVSRDEEEVQF